VYWYCCWNHFTQGMFLGVGLSARLPSLVIFVEVPRRMSLARCLSFCESGVKYAVLAVFVGLEVGGVSQIEACGCVKLVCISEHTVSCQDWSLALFSAPWMRKLMLNLGKFLANTSASVQWKSK
jgi:hypothetical protein